MCPQGHPHQPGPILYPILSWHFRVIFLHLVRCNGEIQIFKKSVFWLKKSCRIDTCIYLMMMQGFVDLKSCLVIFFHEFNVMER